MSARVHLRHVDPAKNMARFYVLALQPTLFGEVALVREWGRIGSPGRVQVTAYATPEEAEAALRRIERQKGRKGYLAHCHQNTNSPFYENTLHSLRIENKVPA